MLDLSLACQISVFFSPIHSREGVETRYEGDHHGNMPYRATRHLD